MRRVMKWIGLTTAGLLVAVLAIGAALYARGGARAGGGAAIPVNTPADSTADSTTLARGRHIAQAITPCESCHGPGLAGKAFPLPPALARMTSTNLTGGRGGVGASYTMEDWDRAIRHGVAKDGRRLMIMPSEAYAHLNNADFAGLVAYLRSLPPTEQSASPRQLGPLGRLLIGAGAFPLAANLIDHSAVGLSSVAPGTTAEFGAYLVDVAGCRVCHASGLTGVTSKQGPPPGPSLVASAATRSLDQFRTTIRTGRTPAGKTLDPESMPWPTYARMTDDELHAIWLYIGSLTPTAGVTQ